MRDALALLEVRALHAHYGEAHVLQGVDLAIAPGQAVGLLGRNGMGKTTLIRTALGLLRASAGTVRIAGQDVTRWHTEHIARLGVGYVPEGRGIFPNLSVRENLVMAARPGLDGTCTWTLERALDAFPRLRQRFGLAGAMLSGGEQQMLAIARALMTNPKLMILDEATEGLAPLVVAEIWRTIRHIRDSGIASLIVDRSFRSVLAHTDRAVVLEKGRIVAEGASAELAAQSELMHRYLGV